MKVAAERRGVTKIETMISSNGRPDYECTVLNTNRISKEEYEKGGGGSGSGTSSSFNVNAQQQQQLSPWIGPDDYFIVQVQVEQTVYVTSTMSNRLPLDDVAAIVESGFNRGLGGRVKFRSVLVQNKWFTSIVNIEMLNVVDDDDNNNTSSSSPSPSLSTTTVVPTTIVVIQPAMTLVPSPATVLPSGTVSTTLLPSDVPSMSNTMIQPMLSVTSSLPSVPFVVPTTAPSQQQQQQQPVVVPSTLTPNPSSMINIGTTMSPTTAAAKQQEVKSNPKTTTTSGSSSRALLIGTIAGGLTTVIISIVVLVYIWSPRRRTKNNHINALEHSSGTGGGSSSGAVSGGQPLDKKRRRKRKHIPQQKQAPHQQPHRDTFIKNRPPITTTSRLAVPSNRTTTTATTVSNNRNNTTIPYYNTTPFMDLLDEATTESNNNDKKSSSTPIINTGSEYRLGRVLSLLEGVSGGSDDVSTSTRGDRNSSSGVGDNDILPENDIVPYRNTGASNSHHQRNLERPAAAGSVAAVSTTVPTTTTTKPLTKSSNRLLLLPSKGMKQTTVAGRVQPQHEQHHPTDHLLANRVPVVNPLRMLESFDDTSIYTPSSFLEFDTTTADMNNNNTTTNVIVSPSSHTTSTSPTTATTTTTSTPTGTTPNNIGTDSNTIATAGSSYNHQRNMFTAEVVEALTGRTMVNLLRRPIPVQQQQQQQQHNEDESDKDIATVADMNASFFDYDETQTLATADDSSTCLVPYNMSSSLYGNINNDKIYNNFDFDFISDSFFNNNTSSNNDEVPTTPLKKPFVQQETKSNDSTDIFDNDPFRVVVDLTAPITFDMNNPNQVEISPLKDDPSTMTGLLLPKTSSNKSTIPIDNENDDHQQPSSNTFDNLGLGKFIVQEDIENRTMNNSTAVVPSHDKSIRRNIIQEMDDLSIERKMKHRKIETNVIGADQDLVFGMNNDDTNDTSKTSKQGRLQSFFFRSTRNMNNATASTTGSRADGGTTGETRTVAYGGSGEVVVSTTKRIKASTTAAAASGASSIRSTSKNASLRNHLLQQRRYSNRNNDSAVPSIQRIGSNVSDSYSKRSQSSAPPRLVSASSSVSKDNSSMQFNSRRNVTPEPVTSIAITAAKSDATTSFQVRPVSPTLPEAKLKTFTVPSQRQRLVTTTKSLSSIQQRRINDDSTTSDNKGVDGDLIVDHHDLEQSSTSSSVLY